MTNILSPRVIFALFLVLGIGALAWFLYFSPAVDSSEIYISEGGKVPIEAGWEAELKKISEFSGGEPGADDSENLGEPPNLTEAFSEALARSLGPRILEEGGLKTISISDLQAAASYIPSAEAILGNYNKVIISELNISEKNDATSVKKYFNDLYSLSYEKAYAGIKESDISAFVKYLQTKNPEELKKIDPIISAFGKSIDAIKNLPIPGGYEEFAIKESDILSRMKRADEIIRDSDKDILAALAVMKARFLMEDELNAFHQDYKKILLEKGIVFSSTDKANKLFR